MDAKQFGRGYGLIKVLVWNVPGGTGIADKSSVRVVCVPERMKIKSSILETSLNALNFSSITSPIQV
jgi:hypothetical protein